MEVPLQELLNTTKVSSSMIPTLNLTEIRCKNYYKILNGNCITEPTGIINWKNKFPDFFTDWGENFSFIYKSTKDNKLRQFLFRLLYRIIMLEVDSLTLVVGLVDSSLISILLKLLQRWLTPIYQGKLESPLIKVNPADDISKPSIFLCRHRTNSTNKSHLTTYYSSHILSMYLRVVYAVTKSISTLIFISLRLRSARTETRSTI